MKRKIYSRLLEWKNQWNGKTALLVDGARRIGKSWIVREFGKNEYKSYILIDFNNAPAEILDLFQHYLADLDSFFTRLSLFTGVTLYERDTLIILDEVQMYPKARAAIKYLVADGRYDYIETGSLVSINHNVKDIVIPSEEIRIDMYPMDLEEFMWAIDQTALFDFVKEMFAKAKPLGQALHRKMMENTRAFLIVGGMPQAVQSYVDTKDFRKVDVIKRNILTLYRNDISKYAGRSAANVTRIFDNIPALLQQPDKRFRPSKIKPHARMRDFYEAIFWLNESRVVNPCYNTTEPTIPLALNKDESKVKLYMADTGLLVSMAFSKSALESGDIYTKILHGKLEFNKGMIVENLIAQLLCSSGEPLFFYKNSGIGNAADRMEIDFLICKENITSRHNVIPIEVKSTNRYTITSLEKFIFKFTNYLSTPVVLHTGDVELENNIKYLPIYMAGLL